jgi:hypothetical protein
MASEPEPPLSSPQESSALRRAQFLALDSSHLGNLARERVSKDASIRQGAAALEQAIKERGYILVLSMHHFQELLVYNDSDVVAQRIAFIQSLPLVGVINSILGEGVAGSVFDIQASEVLAAFQRPNATPRAIRDEVATQMFRLTSGAEAVRPFLVDLPAIQAELTMMAEKHRNIVAITSSDFAKISNKKVVELIKGKLHAPLDIQRNLARLEAALSEDIRQHGDERISSPDSVSAAFMADIRRRGLALADGGNPGLQILAACDVEPTEITPTTTVGEVGEWAVFRGRLKRLNRVLQLPWDGLKTRVKEERIPSGVISSALARFRPRTDEWKGSDLIDVHLACLSPYADITFVDKRTHEGLRIARQKTQELPRIIHRVEKAKNTRVILEHLR